MFWEVLFKIEGKGMSTVVDGNNKTEAKKNWRMANPTAVFGSISKYA